MENKVNSPSIGMSFVHPSLLKEGEFSLLVNGNIVSFSNTFLKITNEPSNLLCSKFKEGFMVIGVQYVPSLSITFFFLVNPSTGASEIGVINNVTTQETVDLHVDCVTCKGYTIPDTPLEQQEQKEMCNYITFVSASCLNFSYDNPVRSWVKVDDCNVRIYFTDNLNPPRYIDFKDYQKVKEFTQEGCPVILEELDCDKIQIFKPTCYPKISYTDIVSGGQNMSGVYQFAVAYADANSNAVTSYFYISNPIPLGDEPLWVNPYPVAKSIKLQVTDISPDFDYFNLVVLKTRNNVVTPYLVGTFQTVNQTFEYIYTGIDKNLVKDVSIDELLKRIPQYDTAFGIDKSNGYSFLYGLTEPRIWNLQPVVNTLRLQWETVILDEGDYKNPVIAATYKGYLRDEVYAFAIEFTRRNAPPTARFHIPGPSKATVNGNIQSYVDLPYITVDDNMSFITTQTPSSSEIQVPVSVPSGTSNPDVFNESACGGQPRNLRWQVYNTATNLGEVDCNIPVNPSAVVNITEEVECETQMLRYINPSGVAYYTTIVPKDFPNNYPLINYGDAQPTGYKPESYYISTINPTGIITGNPSGLCECSTEGYPDDFGPPSAVQVPITLNPTATEPSFDEVSEQEIIETETYVKSNTDFSGAGINIPQVPKGFSSTAKAQYGNPCKNKDQSGDGGWRDWLDQKDNSSPEDAQQLLPSQSTGCDSNVSTYGAFIYDPTDTPNGTSFYSFQPTSGNGGIGNAVAALIFSSDNLNWSVTIRLTNGTSIGTINVSTSNGPAKLPSPIVPVLNSDPPKDYGVYYKKDGDGFYVLITGLTLGETYFLEVSGTPIPADNFTFGCRQKIFRICQVTPKPLQTEKKVQPALIIVTTTCNITYRGNFKNNCVAEPYQHGEFAYWESSETYPCNPEVWGELSGQPIRHHKFPDCKISPHFETFRLNRNDPKYNFYLKDKILPIGVSINAEDIKQALFNAVNLGLISDEERKSICGYRIVRSNRFGNESIIAKGILYDVWRYKDNVYKSGKNILYANYPYNDGNEDPLILAKQIKNRKDLNKSAIQPPNPAARNKFVFHGPNTSYNNPGLGNELKLELELQGGAEGRYSEVKSHAKHQYVGAGMLQAAMGFSAIETYVEATALVLQSSVSTSVFGTSIPLGWILALVSANFAAPGLLLKHYYEWLEILTNFAPFRNYAWYFTSIGNYSIYNTTKIVPQNIRRALNEGVYLKQGIYNVKDGNNFSKFNNIKREGSVYLNTLEAFQKTELTDNSRWYPGQTGYKVTSTSTEDINCGFLGYKYTNISSYYSSIKNTLVSQYGQINNIDYIDTGYNGVINWDETQDTTCDPIFGGDTFICRDWYRRQFPYFLDDAVGQAPNSDIVYLSLGNVGYPKFFMNYPVGADGNRGGKAIYGNVALKTNTSIDYNFSCEGGTGSGIYAAGLTFGILGAIGAGIGAVISIPITYGVLAGIAAKTSGGNTDVFLKGRFFLYSYGEPGYISESNYNLDLRNGQPGSPDKNFYPNVGDMITWTQPAPDYNLINFDNTYFYDNDYSKQNRENFGFVLKTDYSQNKEDCRVLHPNRVIYSVQDNDTSDIFDGNLVFLANNFYDFSKEGGKLTIVKGVNNNRMLAIQENQASIFNSYVTLQTSIGTTAVGSNTLFSQTPQQYIKTDIGYAGSQTQAIATTEFGTYWVDNKRGQIFEYSDGIKNIIEEKDAWWFKENLPFKILNYFPNVDLNNPYKGVGMLVAYDQRYKRVFFTKKDYKPIVDGITYSNGAFYKDNAPVSVEDSTYFCNQSFTIGYSPLTKSFVSFYSFIPDYYNSLSDYFQTGINGLGVYNHLLSNKTFTVFYGKKEPFIFEHSVVSGASNSIFNSHSYLADYFRFIDNTNSYKQNNLTYSHATIYNTNQSTGLLRLIPKEKNNMLQAISYPKFRNDQVEILTENVENIWRFNQFQDLSLQNNQPLLSYQCNPAYKKINDTSISYIPKYLSVPLRSNYHIIRLEDRLTSNYQIVHNFNITQTNNSIS